MLTKHQVTWKENEFKPEPAKRVKFESMVIPGKPLHIAIDGKEIEIISLKYYTIHFKNKSFTLCIGQYINQHGQIEQVAIAGTGHENIYLDGIEYSEILTK